jgi:hypothetical protein
MRHGTRTNPSSARRRDQDVLANITSHVPPTSTQRIRDELVELLYDIISRRAGVSQLEKVGR